MKNLKISREEIETLIRNVEDDDIKKELKLISKNFGEIPASVFFEKIKKIEKLNSSDYKLFLLLEEFYLRFKDAEEKIKNDR